MEINAKRGIVMASFVAVAKEIRVVANVEEQT
jgi:hypothetical protein